MKRLLVMGLMLNGSLIMATDDVKQEDLTLRSLVFDRFDDFPENRQELLDMCNQVSLRTSSLPYLEVDNYLNQLPDWVDDEGRRLVGEFINLLNSASSSNLSGTAEDDSFSAESIEECAFMLNGIVEGIEALKEAGIVNDDSDEEVFSEASDDDVDM